MRTTGCSECDFARLFLPAYYRQEQGHGRRGLSDCGTPSHRSNIVSRPHAASPRPLARTTRNEAISRLDSLPQPPIHNIYTYIYIYMACMMSLWLFFVAYEYWRLGGVSPTGKSISVSCRACERARRGEAAWASERHFDSGARVVPTKKFP